MTKREQLVRALRNAGHRGLTGRELQPLIGERWRQHLRELEHDGYVLCRHKSRITGRIWRWSLVTEPEPAPEPPREEQLLDPSVGAPPPLSPYEAD